MSLKKTRTSETRRLRTNTADDRFLIFVHPELDFPKSEEEFLGVPFYATVVHQCFPSGAAGMCRISEGA
jgi:hypothetical protein